MSKLLPEKPNEVIRKLRALGYEGPLSGGRHVFMRHPKTRDKIPVPYHKGKDIPKGTNSRSVNNCSHGRSITVSSM